MPTHTFTFTMFFPFFSFLGYNYIYNIQIKNLKPTKYYIKELKLQNKPQTIESGTVQPREQCSQVSRVENSGGASPPRAAAKNPHNTGVFSSLIPSSTGGDLHRKIKSKKKPVDFSYVSITVFGSVPLSLLLRCRSAFLYRSVRVFLLLLLCFRWPIWWLQRGSRLLSSVRQLKP